MRQLRLLLVGAICLIGGIVLLLRSFSEPIPIEKLEKVSGKVRLDYDTRSYRGFSEQYPVFVIKGSRYKYLDWFPNAEGITSLVRDGEEVTIWTDRGDNNWVWQIEQNGQIVIPYSEVRNAIASNTRFDWLWGGGLFSIGIVGIVMFFRQSSQVNS